MLMHHSGVPYQQGEGLGNLFRGLFRTIVPVAKSFMSSSTGQALKNVAIDTAKNLASDVLEGNNVKESAAARLSAAKRDISSLISDKINDPPTKKPRTVKKRRKKKKLVGLKTNAKFNLLNA